MNEPEEWLLLQAISLHEHESCASQLSRHIFPGISDDQELTVLLCCAFNKHFNCAFNKHFNFITILVYYFLVPEVADVISFILIRC